MLSRGPIDHLIIMEYLKTAICTGVGGSEEEIYEEDIPRKKVKSSRRKGKTIMSKKYKNHKRAKPQLVIEEDSSEHIASLDRNEKESALNNEVTSDNIGAKSISILEPIQTLVVSSHMESESGIYTQVVNDPFLNISQTPPTPPIVSEISLSTPIPTSPFFGPVSHPSTKSVEIPIFSKATSSHVSAPQFTSTPSVSDDGEEEILMKDDCESNDEFVATDFVFHVESDHEDDDAPMIEGDLRKLDKKLYEIISQYSTFINIKYEELLFSHQAKNQKLVKEYVNKLSQHQKLVDDSAKPVKEASSQVSTILIEVKTIASKHEAFMTSFQTSFDTNVAEMNKNIVKIHLEKKSMEDKLKNLREKKTGQKGNEAFGSGKGNVKIVSEKLDDSDPPLKKEQQDD
ncbi:unnamed protein product [Lactuca virosa]|uniref:Uncharacterized protein n=1 Tax=Lactuca virosa TaxID=75947 RepID=A0AAU9MEX1_9ASTR|nr:unnamed protein product [Lactuca virosa]